MPRGSNTVSAAASRPGSSAEFVGADRADQWLRAGPVAFHARDGRQDGASDAEHVDERSAAGARSAIVFYGQAPKGSMES